MNQYILSEQAKADIQGIWDYIAEDNQETADRAVDEIINKLLLLAKFPQMGRNKDELIQGLKSFPVKDYLIFYKLENNATYIFRIVHGARDLENLI